MSTRIVRTVSVLSLAAVLAGGASLAQAQQVQARVISTSPVTQSNGSIHYNVVYEYAGRQYNTVANTPPGASILVNVSDYGVATTTPVAPQPQLAANPGYNPNPYQASNANPYPSDNNPQNWANVVPEQGMVVSGTGAPAPVYAQSAPVYAPAPVYVQPAPVYYTAPAYYPAPYAYPSYPPIGISLGFGYSRGWGGGYGGYGRWR